MVSYWGTTKTHYFPLLPQESRVTSYTVPVHSTKLFQDCLIVILLKDFDSATTMDILLSLI